MNKSVRFFISALALGGIFALAGCGGGTGDNPNGGKAFNNGSGGGTSTGSSGATTGTGTGTTTSPPVSAPAPTLGAGCANSGTDIICLTLSSASSSLPADNTSTTVLTSTLTRNGSAMPGVILDFALGSANFGTLTAVNGVTSASGVVTDSFQAGGTIGAVAVTVTHAASGASNTLALSLTQAAGNTPAGIQFITASPAVLGVSGSGQQSTSSVQFKVTDTNGLAVSGTSVNFTLVGPRGAYIGPNDSTPTQYTAQTGSAGTVTVPLTAGTAAGPVTITASVPVGAITFTTSTSVISIGGAVPSATHFTLATSKFNLPGFVRANEKADLTVLLADRFSNFNILSGTQVSFFTEAGAVDTSVNLDDTGAGTVVFRTQNPMPFVVNAAHPFFPNAKGWLSVIAVARGEEGFADVNGNGLFDAGTDTFNASMDMGEPFVDSNDNNVWDGPGCTQVGCDSTHPGEFFVDANGNNKYDGPNGVWDGPGCTQAGCDQSPMIWKSILMQFTGNVTSCTINPGFVAVPNASSQQFTVVLQDLNGNAPVAGTTISVASNAGSLQNGTGTVLDGVSSAPFSHTFTLSDSDPATSTATPVTLTITVTTPAGVTSCLPFTITGNIN